MGCEICHGKGLLPYIKDGRTIPYVYIDCECKTHEPEHFTDYRPGDFDFPCSDTFRGYQFEICGLPDPGRIEKPSTFIVEENPREIVVKHHYINQEVSKGVTPAPAKDKPVKTLKDISF